MHRRRIKVWVHQRDPSRNLQLEWLDPNSGKRKSQSAGTRDPADAEEKRQALEYELNHGLYLGTSNMSWDTFRQHYEKERLSGKSLNTRKMARYVFNSFERFGYSKAKAVREINERTLSLYSAKLRENGLGPDSIKRHLAYLKAALRWAARQRIISEAPAVEMPKIPKGSRKATIRAAGKITGEEFERLLMKAPNDGWRLLLGLGWHGGLRRNEARNVRGEDVDLEEHAIALPTNKADDESQTAIITEAETGTKEVY